MAVVCGSQSTAMVDKDGTLYIFSGFMATTSPRRLAFAHVVQIATNRSSLKHTAAVSKEGLLWTWGFGERGRLGHGSEANQRDPVHIPIAVFGGASVAGVACGRDHTVVVTTGGNVFAFGNGGYGQLGVGLFGEADECFRSTPTRVCMPADTHITMTAAGDFHTVAVCTQGNVWAWGCSRDGKLGTDIQQTDMYEERNHTPMPVVGLNVAKGESIEGLIHGNKVVFVAASTNHTVAVTAGGEMLAWGSNVDQLLGLGIGFVSVYRANKVLGPPFDWEQEENQIVVMASCAPDNTLAVTQAGGVWWCGRSWEMGGPDQSEMMNFSNPPTSINQESSGEHKIVTATLLNSDHILAVTEHGEVYISKTDRIFTLFGQGLDDFGPIGPYASIPKPHAIAFAMGTHIKLGTHNPLQVACESTSRKDKTAASHCDAVDSELTRDCHFLHMPSELVRRIVERANAAEVLHTEGYRRLLGGGG